ncbi:hypothetical protein BV22DRAFT_1052010 [Leucogyrophana mollusca]|uniref:Uncharacterized protein n=1 Tax=Leucogyrophana mollusca TaxID=85980 RepID=A0ACB8AXB2_9AGAM|nr:hypothetical protein BV22DRAFT_1052010 [Leucogyrophana mollusca]
MFSPMSNHGAASHPGSPSFTSDHGVPVRRGSFSSMSDGGDLHSVRVPLETQTTLSSPGLEQFFGHDAMAKPPGYGIAVRRGSFSSSSMSDGEGPHPFEVTPETQPQIRYAERQTHPTDQSTPNEPPSRVSRPSSLTGLEQFRGHGTMSELALCYIASRIRAALPVLRRPLGLSQGIQWYNQESQWYACFDDEIDLATNAIAMHIINNGGTAPHIPQFLSATIYKWLTLRNADVDHHSMVLQMRRCHYGCPPDDPTLDAGRYEDDWWNDLRIYNPPRTRVGLDLMEDRAMEHFRHLRVEFSWWWINPKSQEKIMYSGAPGAPPHLNAHTGGGATEDTI